MLRVVAVVVVVAMMATTFQVVLGHKAALLIIDMQACFLPGGSLPVKDGDQVIPVINQLRERYGGLFSLVVLTQDWHCHDHVSFASQHPKLEPYSTISLFYNAQGTLCYSEFVSNDYPHAVNCDDEATGDHQREVRQMLWPDHCVINVTSGPASAEISPLLTVKDSDIIVRKGHSCGIDSYSAFYDNGGFRQTELDGILKKNGIDVVVVTGLALDYCVCYTSKDAHALGYKVFTVTDASRGVMPDTTEHCLKDMKAVGIELVKLRDLEGAMEKSSDTGECEPSSLSFILMAVVGALLTVYLLLKTRP